MLLFSRLGEKDDVAAGGYVYPGEAENVWALPAATMEVRPCVAELDHISCHFVLLAGFGHVLVVTTGRPWSQPLAASGWPTRGAWKGQTVTRLNLRWLLRIQAATAATVPTRSHRGACERRASEGGGSTTLSCCGSCAC